MIKLKKVTTKFRSGLTIAKEMFVDSMVGIGTEGPAFLKSIVVPQPYDKNVSAKDKSIGDGLGLAGIALSFLIVAAVVYMAVDYVMNYA